MWASLEVFFNTIISKKNYYLLETKVSNRLLLVLGVISPRAKSPFIFLTFLFFTPHVRHFKHVFGFRSFQGRIFFCFWLTFGIICLFKALLAKCLMQKCECVVPEQCMFT